MSNLSQFQFKYEGQNYIDINTLLTSQLHFVGAINELQKELYPDAKINIKVGPYAEGSFIVNLLFESGWLDTLFKPENANVVAEIVLAFGGVVTLVIGLKGKKPKHIEEKTNVFILTGEDDNVIEVDKKVFNIYRSNRYLNESIKKNFDLLQKDEEVKGIKVIDHKSKKEVVAVDREKFQDLANENPFFDTNKDEQIHFEQTLYIKKPNLFPEKNRVWNWGFIYRGRDITAKINDEGFRKRIDNGERVAQGDRIIVTLKIHFKFDEKLMTYIETNRFEVMEIKQLIPRPEHPKINFEQI